MSQADQSEESNDGLDPSEEPRTYPSCLRNGSTSSNNSLGKHRVTFPDDDSELVTAYLEPASPWDSTPVTPEDLIGLYEESCDRHHTKPLEQVIEQLKTCYQPHPTLEISGIITLETLEALEIVLKRVRFSTLRISSRELNDDAAVALFDMLEFYESAATLSLTCEGGLGQRSWQACSRMIKKTHGLTELDVRGTPVNEQVMPVLCRSLKIGSKLTALQLGRCGASERSLIMLVNALRHNIDLKELTLADNNLMASDATQLGMLLKDNSNLRYLDISNNAIGDAGCASICDALREQHNEGLQALVMWNTALTAAAAPHLAKALASESLLETLNIGQNQIGKEGLSEMKAAMIGNRRLKLLGVQAAHISCDGAEIIADVLRGNKTLERLDARSNNIGERGLTALKAALLSGAPLQRLDLDDVPGVCQPIIDDIRTFCQTNEAKVEEESQRSSSFSRKISLTCETMMMRTAVDGRGLLAEPRRPGRLRSPAPSPIPSPSSSPIPSPSRNRFRVSRVSEASSPVSPISPVASRFRVTVVEPEPDKPPESPRSIIAEGTKVQIGFKPVPEPPTPAPPPAAQPPQRKLSTTSKPQSSMEKLLGLFQNPTSLFSSVANVTFSGDKEKNTQSQESGWDWDWSSKDSSTESKTNNNV